MDRDKVTQDYYDLLGLDPETRRPYGLGESKSKSIMPGLAYLLVGVMFAAFLILAFHN